VGAEGRSGVLLGGSGAGDFIDLREGDLVLALVDCNPRIVDLGDWRSGV